VAVNLDTLESPWRSEAGCGVHLDTGAGIMAITGAVAVYLDTLDTGRASWRSPGLWL
jgi:hypothetical protein